MNFQPQSVEYSVMSRGFSLSSFKADMDRKMHPEQYAALQQTALTCTPVVAVDASTLPTMQQAALMQMHESHVKRALIAALLEDSQDRPDAPDYQALCELGLAERREGYRFRSLTVPGVESAKFLERSLCLKFDVHLMTEGSQTGWEVRYSCPCGFSTMVRRSRTAYGNAAIRHQTYIRTQARLAGLRDALKPVGETEGA